MNVNIVFLTMSMKFLQKTLRAGKSYCFTLWVSANIHNLLVIMTILSAILYELVHTFIILIEFE